MVSISLVLEIEMGRVMFELRKRLSTRPAGRSSFDLMVIAGVIYLVVAVFASLVSVDMSSLVGDGLLLQESRFRGVLARNPSLSYAPSLYFLMFALYPVVLISNCMVFHSRLDWTALNETRLGYLRLFASTLFLGIGTFLMMFVVFDIGPTTSVRSSALMEMISYNDVTFALTIFFAFWTSALMLAGSYFYFAMARRSY